MPQNSHTLENGVTITSTGFEDVICGAKRRRRRCSWPNCNCPLKEGKMPKKSKEKPLTASGLVSAVRQTMGVPKKFHVAHWARAAGDLAAARMKAASDKPIGKSALNSRITKSSVEGEVKFKVGRAGVFDSFYNTSLYAQLCVDDDLWCIVLRAQSAGDALQLTTINGNDIMVKVVRR